MESGLYIYVIVFNSLGYWPVRGYFRITLKHDKYCYTNVTFMQQLGPSERGDLTTKSVLDLTLNIVLNSPTQCYRLFISRRVKPLVMVAT